MYADPFWLLKDFNDEKRLYTSYIFRDAKKNRKALTTFQTDFRPSQIQIRPSQNQICRGAFRETNLVLPTSISSNSKRTMKLILKPR